MFPNYPKTKSAIREAFHGRIKAAEKGRLGIFGDVPETIVHEGTRCIMYREDGTEGRVELDQPFEATAKLTRDEIGADGDVTIEHYYRMADVLGQKLAEGKIAAFVKALDQAVAQVGNFVDSTQPFVEQLFQANEKRLIDFDAAGYPVPTQLLVGNEETATKLREAMEQIKAEPVLRRRYEALMTKKRQEWLDREAARNLVE